MDSVVEGQFRLIQHNLAREGVDIEFALTPDGDIDYVYQVGRLLALDEPGVFRQLRRVLPGIVRTDEPAYPGLVLLSIDNLDEGYLTVPEALDLVDEELGRRRRRDRLPSATPNHLVHIARLCPGGEPERPPGVPPLPWPPPRAAGSAAQNTVLLEIVDTGLLDGPLPPWLQGVNGDLDPLGPKLRNGRDLIPPYTGHGTFVAGVARCLAPHADVHISDHFSRSGGMLETEVVSKLDEAVNRRTPTVINLSAGFYSCKNLPSLAFERFHEIHPDVVLVAAAGNDGGSREFYPAAAPWAVGVGALGPDQTHRAWFSNHGPWVDVFAPGEGMVNAYATGDYRYREPPKAPATQSFEGMARWDGTSFAAPLVAGMIADLLAQNGGLPSEATKAVLLKAQANSLPKVGPALQI